MNSSKLFSTFHLNLKNAIMYLTVGLLLKQLKDMRNMTKKYTKLMYVLYLMCPCNTLQKTQILVTIGRESKSNLSGDMALNFPP